MTGSADVRSPSAEQFFAAEIQAQLPFVVDLRAGFAINATIRKGMAIRESRR